MSTTQYDTLYAAHSWHHEITRDAFWCPGGAVMDATYDTLYAAYSAAYNAVHVERNDETVDAFHKAHAALVEYEERLEDLCR